MKTGSIYTDMIKPLEKSIYSWIRYFEDQEIFLLDKEYPHLRGFQEKTDKLQSFLEMRKIVPLVAETVVKIALWKDMNFDSYTIIPALRNNYAFIFYFPNERKINFRSTFVRWLDSTVPEWLLVVKGEMTPEAFVELIKARQVGVRTGDAEVIPCVISHPGTGIHFSGSTEDGINFLLKELIQARENLAAQEAAKIPYLKFPTDWEYREYPVENEQASTKKSAFQQLSEIFRK